MTPSLVPLLAKPAVIGAGKLIGAWWKLAVGMIVGLALGYFIGHYFGFGAGKEAEAAQWRARVAEVAQRAEIAQRSADEAMRQAEILANQRIATNRREVDEAVANLPDNGLSARQRARACIELRRQNASPSAINAACGPAQPSR